MKNETESREWTLAELTADTIRSEQSLCDNPGLEYGEEGEDSNPSTTPPNTCECTYHTEYYLSSDGDVDTYTYAVTCGYCKERQPATSDIDLPF